MYVLVLPLLPYIRKKKGDQSQIVTGTSGIESSMWWHPSSSATGVAFGVGCYI